MDLSYVLVLIVCLGFFAAYVIALFQPRKTLVVEAGASVPAGDPEPRRFDRAAIPNLEIPVFVKTTDSPELRVLPEPPQTAVASLPAAVQTREQDASGYPAKRRKKEKPESVLAEPPKAKRPYIRRNAKNDRKPDTIIP